MTQTLLTVPQFAEKHTAFTQGGLRWMIFNAREKVDKHGVKSGNGLDYALVRIGRRVLIDEAKFFEWVDSKQGEYAHD